MALGGSIEGFLPRLLGCCIGGCSQVSLWQAGLAGVSRAEIGGVMRLGIRDETEWEGMYERDHLAILCTICRRSEEALIWIVFIAGGSWY